jgi:GH24 family phage-related lysozyme (muramidase)
MFKYLIVLSLVFLSFNTDTFESINVYQTSEKETLINIDLDLIFALIKCSEGLRLKPYADGHRTAIGYGTSSRNRSYISKEEAFCELQEAYFKKLKYINLKYPRLDSFTALVMAAFKYNVSTIGSELNSALYSNNKKLIAEKIKLYNKDRSGSVLRGLERRRSLEAAILLSDEKSKKHLLDSLNVLILSK